MPVNRNFDGILIFFRFSAPFIEIHFTLAKGKLFVINIKGL